MMISFLFQTTLAFAVIYSSDSREDVKSQMPPAARATAVLFDLNQLKFVSNSAVTFRPFSLQQAYPLCVQEKFLDQTALGFCSAVLIAPQRVLTAGHCVHSQSQCEKMGLVFGWNQETAQSQRLKSKDLYRCRSILKRELHPGRSGLDYAILELDRKPEGVQPVKLGEDSQIPRNSRVVNFSYPLGIPLKMDFGSVLENDPGSLYLSVAIDTFSGSSGSGLFNARGEMIGLLNRGSEDFLEDDIRRVQTQGGCLNIHRCDQTRICRGERFLRSSLISL